MVHPAAIAAAEQWGGRVELLPAARKLKGMSRLLILDPVALTPVYARNGDVVSTQKRLSTRSMASLQNPELCGTY